MKNQRLLRFPKPLGSFTKKMFDKIPSQAIIPFPYHSLDYNDNRNTVDLQPNIPRLYNFRLLEHSALYRHRFYCIMNDLLAA